MKFEDEHFNPFQSLIRIYGPLKHEALAAALNVCCQSSRFVLASRIPFHPTPSPFTLFPSAILSLFLPPALCPSPRLIFSSPRSPFFFCASALCEGVGVLCLCFVAWRLTQARADLMKLEGDNSLSCSLELSTLVIPWEIRYVLGIKFLPPPASHVHTFAPLCLVFRHVFLLFCFCKMCLSSFRYFYFFCMQAHIFYPCSLKYKSCSCLRILILLPTFCLSPSSRLSRTSPELNAKTPGRLSQHHHTFGQKCWLIGRDH